MLTLPIIIDFLKQALRQIESTCCRQDVSGRAGCRRGTHLHPRDEHRRQWYIAGHASTFKLIYPVKRDRGCHFYLIPRIYVHASTIVGFPIR